MRNEENKISYLKLQIPEFLFGAMLLIDIAINLIYERINRVVAQIPNTLYDSFGNSIF